MTEKDIRAVSKMLIGEFINIESMENTMRMDATDTQLKSTFSNEATYYDETTQYLLLNYSQTLKQVVQQLGQEKNLEFSILDVGCGTGNLVQMIREEYCCAQIDALDFSEDMLNVAREKNVSSVHFINEDLNNVNNILLSHSSFDYIIATFVFHNFHSYNDHIRAMKALRQRLAENGKLIIADLIDPGDSVKRQENQRKLENVMRKHHLTEEEIIKWNRVLAEEDRPLTIQATIQCMYEAGYHDVHSIPSSENYSAIFVGQKKPMVRPQHEE